jgi:hydroxyethylthiazole kinase
VAERKTTGKGSKMTFYRLIETVQRTNPLVLNLTNVVTMDFMANVLLAMGASPLMSQSRDEFEALVQISHAVNINIGTLTSDFITDAVNLSTLAKKAGKPIVFDPVGVGASDLRLEAALTLLPFATVLKGNASEIITLANKSGTTKGVDALHSTEEAANAGKLLSKQYGMTVVITGKVDKVIFLESVYPSSLGSPMMSLITGTGCALGAVLAAFVGVHADVYFASKVAVDYYGKAGALASFNAKGPGSCRMSFLDALYCLSQSKEKGRT